MRSNKNGLRIHLRNKCEVRIDPGVRDLTTGVLNGDRSEGQLVIRLNLLNIFIRHNPKTSASHSLVNP